MSRVCKDAMTCGAFGPSQGDGTVAPRRDNDRRARQRSPQVLLVLDTIIHVEAVGAPTYGALPLAHRRLAEADASLTVDVRDLFSPDDFIGDDVLGHWAERRGARVEGVDVGDRRQAS